MAGKLINSSDLRQEAQKLLADGKMPDLTTLLSAVGQARQKYGPSLKAARHLPLVEDKTTEPSTMKVDWGEAVKKAPAKA